jgi:uncharacterized membrane protein YgdD (TMEM256/DUF423 family)
MHKPALTWGAVFAALAVILGAFGAHALKAIMPPEQVTIFETGVRYQMYHSFALLLVGVVHMAYPAKMIRTATILFITGILLFSGSLYAMALLSIKGVGIGPVGILTPIGGLFFILGWLFLLLGILKKS